MAERKHKRRVMVKVPEAAKRMGVSPRYLRGLLAEGRLQYHRLSRRLILIEQDEIDRFLDACRIDSVE